MTEEAVVDEAADAAANEPSGEAETNDASADEPPLNIYDELRKQLKAVRDILEERKTDIQPAVQTLAKLVPEINEMIDELVKIIKMVKDTIMNLDTSIIPIDKVRPFIEAANALLGTAEKLLPEDKEEDLATARKVVNVVDTFPTPEQIKQQTEGLLNEVIDHLEDLKAA